jgi:hypothetical protein
VRQIESGKSPVDGRHRPIARGRRFRLMKAASGRRNRCRVLARLGRDRGSTKCQGQRPSDRSALSALVRRVEALTLSVGFRREEIYTQTDLATLKGNAVRGEFDQLVGRQVRLFGYVVSGRQEQVNTATVWQTTVNVGVSVRF